MNLSDFQALSASFGLSAKEAEQQFPLVQSLTEKILQQKKDTGMLVGVAGSQGSGKSTLAGQLHLMLEERGVQSVQTSIDDFYLSKQARQLLAEQIHPLFLTRGVPGTHDMSLLANCVDQILAGKSAELPIFDKLNDDRSNKTLSVPAGTEVMLLEGWCVGAPVLDAGSLALPINDLERHEDADGIWRRSVAAVLASDSYQSVFQRIEMMIFLKIPDFSFVSEWRGRQEAHLARQMPGRKPMSPSQLARFVAHYERITQHMLNIMPETADVLIHVDENHHLHPAASR